MKDDTRKIYSLSDLGKSLRSVIERAYTSTYWIKAEIAKLNYYPRSGHCYPELVEKTGNVIQAQMRATLWATDYSRLNRQFTEVTGDKLREGITILFRASITYHPVYGLSLQVHEIEPAFTLGEMALEKSKTIEKLKKEGIFGRNKELTFPLLPKRIAVISVETSKGYNDFLNIITSKSNSYHIWHYLFPSVLQGDKAVEGILSQLRIIKKTASRFDMVAIIRGGGGDIGLSCYDDYKLARETALFPLPVITGIGHSTNETITEMVAWSNKITPTDVAYFIIEKFRDYEQRIDDAATALQSRGMLFLQLEQKQLAGFSGNLVRGATHLLNLQKSRLGDNIINITHTSKYLQSAERERISALAMQITVRPAQSLFKQHCTLDKQLLRLLSAAKARQVSAMNRLETLENKTQLLNPENILKRGYSFTRLDGRSIRNAEELRDGDVLETQFHKGKARSIVRK
ncbi:MAG: exodeoxyribonuclease VII large subunit [Bacteroidales bacterium]|nr:exodeoxyribonuclease VII large subunit [Bacteroidales bacterium]